MDVMHSKPTNENMGKEIVFSLPSIFAFLKMFKVRS